MLNDNEVNSIPHELTPVTDSVPVPVLVALPQMNVPTNGAQPENRIHLWIQKRTGKKRLTFIQGIPETINWTELAQKLRQQFHCNCTEIEHPKLGKCIQMSGDFREELKQLFVKNNIVRNKNQIKVHGD